ncbi:hypothetical protein EJD97_023892 [Solanum chilense]|uniref:CCHC-type domain-containing protein n=1 Tax=Solanum chilense TaxID=4083 RepID=A0A6N2C3B9_SOLCI|nr:hypothetical protein EJD97_023892 [Solanum chilense]
MLVTRTRLRFLKYYSKRPRSDDSSHQKPKKRLFLQESSIVNKDRSPNKHSQGGVHTFERTRCDSCGKQHLGKCLVGTDHCFACGSKGHKMRDFPNIKARMKEFNKSPQGGLYPNAPKKNHSYGWEL